MCEKYRDLSFDFQNFCFILEIVLEKEKSKSNNSDPVQMPSQICFKKQILFI